MRCLFVLLLVVQIVGLEAVAQDLEYTQSVTLRFEEERGGEVRLHEETEVEVRYLSERSSRVRAFYVQDAYYAPVESIHAWWNGRRLDGDAIQIRTPQSEDLFLTPGAVHEVLAPGAPKPGDVLSYRFRRAFQDVAYAPILSIPSVDRVAEYEIVVEHPSSFEVEFEVFDPRGRPAPIVEQGARETRLRFENLAPSDILPLLPHGAMMAEVMVRVTRDGVPLLPTSPDAFASWYGGLSASARPSEASPALVDLAESLRRDSDVATVGAIHDHIRSSVRYVADERAAGAIVPRVPDLVLAQGYGDCKDRAFLAAALARVLGLTVDVVLVATSPVADFDAAHVSLYDHMIAAWDDHDGETIYFDPTHRHVPFGSLPESDVSAQALRISEGGARRVVLPVQAAAPLMDVVVRGGLEAPDEATAEITVRGPWFGLVRQAMVEGRDVDVENVLSGLASASLYKIRLRRFVPLSVAGDSAVFQSEADLSEFVIASPTRRYLPTTPFRAVPSEVSERADDGLPIWTVDRPDVRLVLDLEASDFAAAPETVRLGEAGTASFTADLVPGDDRTQITYRFRQSARRFDGADRDAYLTLALAYLDARRDMFVFRPSETSSSELQTP